MKKINLLFALLMMVSLGFFSSCSTEDTEDAEKPTMTITGGTETEYLAGAEIVYTITLGSPSEKLQDFKVTSNTAGDEGTGITAADPETSINEDLTVATPSTVTFDKVTGSTITYKFVVPAAAVDGQSFTLTFTVTNDKGTSVDETKSFTVKSGAPVNGPIATYTAVLLGAQSNTSKGSYYSTSDNTVMLSTDAKANASKVDLIYYYGTTNKATVCSPTDATVNGGSGNLTLAVGLSPQNATKIATSTVSSTDFDAITDDGTIKSVTPSGTIVKELAVNNVVAFETAAGKKGLFKVTAIDSTSSGTITIEVKVQTDATTE